LRVGQWKTHIPRPTSLPLAGQVLSTQRSAAASGSPGWPPPRMFTLFGSSGTNTAVRMS